MAGSDLQQRSNARRSYIHAGAAGEMARAELLAVLFDSLLSSRLWKAAKERSEPNFGRMCYVMSSISNAIFRLAALLQLLGLAGEKKEKSLEQTQLSTPIRTAEACNSQRVLIEDMRTYQQNVKSRSLDLTERELWRKMVGNAPSPISESTIKALDRIVHCVY